MNDSLLTRIWIFYRDGFRPETARPRASSPDLAAGQQAECETPDRRRGIQQAVRQAARLADHPVGHVQLYP